MNDAKRRRLLRGVRADIDRIWREICEELGVPADDPLEGLGEV